jgi:hypothetical protein
VVPGSAAFDVRYSFACAVLVPKVTKSASCSTRDGRAHGATADIVRAESEEVIEYM